MLESSSVLKEIKTQLLDGQADVAYDTLMGVTLTEENSDSYYWCLCMYNILKGNTENNFEYFEKNITLLQGYLKDAVSYSNEDLWHLLLTSYLNKNDFEELFSDCKYVISKLEKSDMAYNLMAQGLNNVGNFSEALFYINKAIDLCSEI